MIELRPEPIPYVCPACQARQPVMPADTRIPMHACAGRAGMLLPMVPEGERSDVRLVERGDFLGSDAGKVRTDAEGRPWMRAEVERPSGQVDMWVYAPTATIESAA